MIREEHMVKRKANTQKYSFLDKLDIDQDVTSRLSLNLANIYSGNDEIYMTPIATEHDPKLVLLKWDKVFQGNKECMNSTLLKIEEAQRCKAGPMSISIPWTQRRVGTLAYFEKTNLDYSSLDATPQAIRDKGRLRPLSLQKAADFLKNSTNSGLPFYTKKGLVKERLLGRFEHYLDRKDPCVLFTRTVEQAKTRDVWGFPIADTLNEMRFYRPILEYQRKLYWRSALNGPDIVDKRMTTIINQALSSNLDLISVDFSAYDRSIKRGLQQKISEYYNYLFQNKYLDEIQYITDRKSTIGLVTPDGVLEGEHGIPSGSTFTNEDDSIAQFIISRASGTTIRDLVDIQGDDGVYAINGDKKTSFYNGFDRYGVELNDKKSDISKEHLVYLQNLYHKEYEKNGVIGGIYPVYRALNRVLYQERWSNFEDFSIKGKDYYSIRTITILENCKHHPLFEKLVKFVYNLDKYKLQVTQQGISDYVKMLTDTSGIEGILVNQYGDNIRGINSFETVKIIKELNKA